MNAAEAAEDERFLGLALVNPAPVLVPHRMIRPYWLVHAVCRLSVSIDSVSFLRPIWRFLLKKVRERERHKRGGGGRREGGVEGCKIRCFERWILTPAPAELLVMAGSPPRSLRRSPKSELLKPKPCRLRWW